MGVLSPETLLLLVAGAAVFILLVAAVVRRSRARRPAERAPVATPAFGSVKPAHPESAPVAKAAPQSGSEPPQASYAAIAAAQAGRAAPQPVNAAATAGRIDYSGALDGIRPDASYTSLAIASLLGLARSDTATSEVGPPAERSYAAIAASMVAGPVPPKPEAPAPARITYSDEGIDLPPAASYTAIAVAAAARAGADAR